MYKPANCECTTCLSDEDINSINGQNIRAKCTTPLCVCHLSEISDFHKAVFTSNFQKVEMYLGQGVPINVVNENGKAVIHIVADRGDIQMLRLFYTHDDLNVDIRDSYGLTALAAACIRQHKKVVKSLLQHGANTNIASKLGRIPLHFTVAAGNIDLTFMLIRSQADVNRADTFGNTPLLYSCIRTPLILMTKLLLTYGALPLLETGKLNTFLETVLDCTTEDKLDMVKVLVETGLNINVKDPRSGCNCLHLAAIHGFIPVIRYLISKEADLMVYDKVLRTPYDIALVHGNIEAADYMRFTTLIKRRISRMRKSVSS